MIPLVAEVCGRVGLDPAPLVPWMDGLDAWTSDLPPFDLVVPRRAGGFGLNRFEADGDGFVADRLGPWLGAHVGPSAGAWFVAHRPLFAGLRLHGGPAWTPAGGWRAKLYASGARIRPAWDALHALGLGEAQPPADATALAIDLAAGGPARLRHYVMVDDRARFEALCGGQLPTAAWELDAPGTTHRVFCTTRAGTRDPSTPTKHALSWIFGRHGRREALEGLADRLEQTLGVSTVDLPDGEWTPVALELDAVDGVLATDVLITTR